MTATRGASSAAIIHDPDGVRFLATAVAGDILLAQVADYVRGRCDDVLWADAAREVHRLLSLGDLRAGITLYFDRTGERWDREQLTLVAAPLATSGPTEEERSVDARR